MHVEVGPVPSSSVLAWVDYAERVLGSTSQAPPLVDEVPPDVTPAFVTYLHEWRKAACSGDPVTFRLEVPGEVAEYHVLVFYRIVERLAAAAEARGEPLAPEEGRAFYLMLVERLLDALADESPSCAEFAEHLRSFWPGL